MKLNLKGGLQMPHEKWCGKECRKCTDDCEVNDDIWCFPSCVLLNPNGSYWDTKCKKTDCRIYKEVISLDTDYQDRYCIKLIKLKPS